ncbi:hypothetical protein KBX50_05290 [Micromonospora sp. C51]|uniref:phage terminase small subunit n=1 Tax=Micromonospora sp. C51 TaxID=2824879 RepID=UPI001B363524|nr:hypothetical protein [Micromonospora sp. C51]MBQ1047873.1 hypothetical protein [Micromonospora sp. C51]
MAKPGPTPKANKHGRSTSGDWTEVVNEPYTGPALDLPKPRRGGPKWLPEVEAWWEQVRRMPHCVLWEPSDWVFAVETAYMKNDWWMEYHGGVVHSTKSTEIRRREDQMGTTREARRKLMIRYVDPPTDEVDEAVPEAAAASGGNVVPLDSRRARVAAG